MKKTIKGFLSVFLTVMIAVYAVVPALAADSSVTYDGGAQKFVFAPGSRYSPSDLFDSFKSVMPGDSLTQRITIKNDVSNNVKVKLYLRSTGAQEGTEEFLSKMNLTVIQERESELFAASADQTAGLTDWVCLGTFYSGAEIDLNVVLDIPDTMDNTFQNAVGQLEWQFRAEELPVDPEDPQPPQTGEGTSVWLAAGICFASFSLMFFLLLTSRRRKAAVRK